MPGMKTLEENIERLESAIARSKEAASEANSATKAANAAAKELRRLEDDFAKRVKEEIDKRFGELVQQGLEEYKEAVTQATHDGYNHVIAEFDKIKNIMLYGNEKGKGEPLVEAWVRKVVNETIEELAR